MPVRGCRKRHLPVRFSLPGGDMSYLLFLRLYRGEEAFAQVSSPLWSV